MRIGTSEANTAKAASYATVNNTPETSLWQPLYIAANLRVPDLRGA